MTVKIPMKTPVPESRLLRDNPVRDTPAWRNFRGSLLSHHPGRPHVDKIKEALMEYGAVWNRGEGVIEFENEKAATMWLLRRS